MRIGGEHTCKVCKRGFEWYYVVPQRINSNKFDVETITKDKMRLYEVYESVERDGYKFPKKASVYCKFCDNLNHIEIEE
ncbi:hypothetical protein [Clostridium sp. YIM B02506]|uniref:hypothetical protein n=1 Tax=Clostridium sp. YIM B02506 TaxID=2910680 RepID=UPI001EEF0B23|nr:hypothetical protein [Clostridium sp. YIM B02506]